MLARVLACRKKDLAHRGRVQGQHGTCRERLTAASPSEDVVENEHLAVVQDADPHRLVAPTRQRIRPSESVTVQLAGVEVPHPESDKPGP